MISNRLKSARTAAGLSQQALSKATGYSQAHISQMESGDRLPSMETARTLAMALKVDLGWLVGEPEPGEPFLYRTDPRVAIVADYQAAPGLRELARDEAVATCLQITAAEWLCLRSIAFPSPPSRAGYLSLLLHIRAISGA